MLMFENESEDVDSAEDDLIALLGSGPAPLVVRTKREFQPWHRPRKQYVRNLQWSREISFLARDLELRNKELRYLTLPGNDLLDIRHLVETICIPSDVSLKYLGFNTSAAPWDEGQSHINSSQFSVNRMDSIHKGSEVYPGDFRMVGDHKSPSAERVRSAGPFHAINLDLCGGFAGRNSENIPNYFTALKALLQNQSKSSEDFLLFITTRMDEQSLDREASKKLLSIAQNIHDTCDKYASSFAKYWDVEEGASGVQIYEAASSGEAFMLGLTQWVVSQGVEEGLKASVRSFMTYRSGSGVGDDDIVSLAIRFAPDPHNRVDPYELALPIYGQPTAAQRICVQSERIPQRVADRTLVDEILRDQAEAFERCVTESSRLLGSVGYDEDSYRAWVMEEKGRYPGALAGNS